MGYPAIATAQSDCENMQDCAIDCSKTLELGVVAWCEKDGKDSPTKIADADSPKSGEDECKDMPTVYSCDRVVLR